jgi:hypothetical protein
MTRFEAEAAATPIIRLAVETMASFDPSTAARSHPMRPLRCISIWFVRMSEVVFISKYLPSASQVILALGKIEHHP